MYTEYELEHYAAQRRMEMEREAQIDRMLREARGQQRTSLMHSLRQLVSRLIPAAPQTSQMGMNAAPAGCD